MKLDVTNYSYNIYLEEDSWAKYVVIYTNDYVTSPDIFDFQFRDDNSDWKTFHPLIVTVSGYNITLPYKLTQKDASYTFQLKGAYFKGNSFRILGANLWGIEDVELLKRPPTSTTTISTSSSLTIQDEGIALPFRSTLNFIGSGVNAVDDPTNNRINITISGGSSSSPTSGTDLSISANNADPGTLTLGQVVFISSSGQVRKACANTNLANSFKAIGLTKDASIAPSATGNILTKGLLTSTDWTAVVGATTLSGGVDYFLDPVISGGMTTAELTTVGQYLVYMGEALTSTSFFIDIDRPIEL
jgi:hypothetical protein